MKDPADVPIKHLVVDTGAFIKRAPLQDIGAMIYSIPQLLDELKSHKVREYLDAVPYEVILREPLLDSIKKVTERAKETGDYPSLSAVDLKVLALTYDLFHENGGCLPSKTDLCHDKVVSGEHVDDDLFKETEDGTLPPGFFTPNERKELNTGSCFEQSLSESEDDEGWVDVQNFANTSKKLGAVSVPIEKEVAACITTDFAIQNVLLSMGLPLISLEGFRIHRLKSYILRCRSCCAITSVMTKRFCPRCGNDSLHRVAVTVNPDGTRQLWINWQRLQSSRGLKFSLPAPKGGKHAIQPILFEDQPVPQNRLARRLQDPLETGPFAMNDVTSRSAFLGIRHLQQNSRRNYISVGPKKKRAGKKR